MRPDVDRGRTECRQFSEQLLAVWRIEIIRLVCTKIVPNGCVGGKALPCVDLNMNRAWRRPAINGLRRALPDECTRSAKYQKPTKDRRQKDPVSHADNHTDPFARSANGSGRGADCAAAQALMFRTTFSRGVCFRPSSDPFCRYSDSPADSHAVAAGSRCGRRAPGAVAPRPIVGSAGLDGNSAGD